MRGTFYYAFAVATFVLLFWTAPINVVIFASLFIGDGIADPVGRLWTSWAGAKQDQTNGITASTPADAVPDKKNDKQLVWLQYRVGWFGTKSYPGSAAFFVSSFSAAALWGTLFSWAGHYGTDFDMRTFLWASALCVGAATVAEAISPPHVDNLLVTYAAAAVAFCLAKSGAAPFMLRGCA